MLTCDDNSAMIMKKKEFVLTCDDYSVKTRTKLCVPNNDENSIIMDI